MYIHLGQDTVIKSSEIIGFFDLDKTSVSKKTKEFLKAAQNKGSVVNVTQELPKSYVLAVNKTKKGKQKTTVYVSQISTSTLNKRSKNKLIVL